jgi:predicted RNA-binding protein Jag
MMTPKDLLDTMLGYLGFVVQIEETTNEGGNATLQIYTEESRRLIGRDGETLEAMQFLLNRLLQARDKNKLSSIANIIGRCVKTASCSGCANWPSACGSPAARFSLSR